MGDRKPGFGRALLSRRSVSEQRRGLRVMLMEGIPAVIIGNLLGGPLQTAFLLFLGFSSTQIGLTLAIPSFTLLVQVFIAFAMQRWRNRRRLVLVFAVCHRILWVATGLIPLLFPKAAWAPLYISLFLVSYASAQICNIVWTSLISDAVPPSVRGKYFGIRNMVHFAVVCVTLLAGGQIMEWLPGSAGFAVLFAISGLCILWNGWELARYPNPPFEPSSKGASFGTLLRPFADQAFISASGFISLFLLLQNVIVPLFSYSMLNVLQLNYSEVTLITMLQNVVMMISYYYWGVANGRYPARKLLLWTFPLIGASCFAWIGMAALPVLPVLILVHVLLGIGLGGYNLLAFNFLIGDSPKSERPMYVAVFNGLTGLAGFLGPLIGGWLFKASADGPVWLLRYGLAAGTGTLLLALAVGAAPLFFRIKRPAVREG
ncbi:MFS transporter [Cohnella caldifontis]|uniref:MFS transporter n=1 Tax=Cohnella caldifontis TaxID=3027471 RepID=UPI0023EBFE4C|nr:MFS transporter [Cohnella sp. YIM B05605]